MKLIAFCVLSFTFTHAAHNLVFIAVDDLGSRINSTGDPYAITPNLDKIHNESIVFTKHFATSPECGPSRTSMMTSLKVENHHVEHFEQFRSLNPRVITLPGLLRSKGGYVTAGVGKVFDFWNFGGRVSSSNIKPDLCTSNSSRCSFDRFSSYNEILPTCMSEIGMNANYLFANSSDDESLTDDCILKNAISQLRGFSQSNRKFALFVGITKPHMPFRCHDSFYKMYETADFSTTFNAFQSKSYFNRISHPYFKSDNREARKYSGFNSSDANKYARAYYACVSQVDTNIGRLIDELDSLPTLSNNTIVVIWGDHGFSVGERNMFGKKTLFENANKSPFMIRLPSRTPQVIKTPISNIDIFPTIADLLNVNIVHKIDGTSTIKLINNVRGYDHPVPFSSFRIYGPSSMIGISRWYKTNTTMTIHRRSSTNKLKPGAKIISRVYKPDTDEKELLLTTRSINP